MKGQEMKYLEKDKKILEKEFGCKIEIISAEKSKHPKAKIAEPEKPGLLVE